MHKYISNAWIVEKKKNTKQKNQKNSVHLLENLAQICSKRNYNKSNAKIQER